MAGPKFTVLYEKLRGQTFELNKETMSIGRREGMDICIKDSSMSGHHADIICTEREGKKVYILRDNESTNGTKVNGAAVTEQELKNSDVVLFGSVEVLFDSGSEEESATGVFAPTSVTLDLSSLDGNLSSVPKFDRLNPLAEQEVKRHKLVTWGIIGLCTLAGAGVLALLFHIGDKLFNL